MENIKYVILALILISCEPNWKTYAKELQEDGYSKVAAEKIAKTEYKLIPVDAEYISLIED